MFWFGSPWSNQIHCNLVPWGVGSILVLAFSGLARDFHTLTMFNVGTIIKFPNVRVVISGLNCHPKSVVARASQYGMVPLNQQYNNFLLCVAVFIWESIAHYDTNSGYFVAFVTSSVPVFCWVCIKFRSTVFFTAL